MFKNRCTKGGNFYSHEKVKNFHYKIKLIESYEDVPEVHLANLEEDMSESNNLADKEPEITEELRSLAENWRKRIEEKWIKEYGAPNEEQRLNTQMGLR